MADSNLRFIAVSLLGLALFGCSKQRGEVDATAPAPNANAAPVRKELTEAEKAVKSGALESAAAQLIQMRVKQKDFSPAESFQYRQVFQDAYEHALQGAANGDPKAAAALALLKASGGR